MTEQEYKEWYDKTYHDTHPIVQRAGRRLVARYCYGLYSDLDDMIHDVYMIMYKKRVKLVEHENITGWLIVALKYKMLQRMRSWARKHEAMERMKTEVKLQKPTGLAQLKIETKEDLELVMSLLGPEKFNMLKEYYLDGVPAEEMARRYGKSVGAFYTYICRLKKRCQDVLNGTGGKTLVALWFAMNFFEW